MPPRSIFTKLALFTTALAFCVVVLGAYVRLSDAGLGCPDWPRCYGQLLVPSGMAANEASAYYPERPLDSSKAWKEMAHRYLAGLFGLSVLVLTIVAWRWRHAQHQQVLLPMILLLLVVGQATLGMLTVTWLLHPTIVVTHLLGGMIILSLCFWLTIHHGALGKITLSPSLRYCRLWVLIGGVLLIGQIALGGWTSANYAALACPDFPTCHGAWWPLADYREGFVLWPDASGVNYEHGHLSGEARIAIHMVHRAGAAIVFLYLGALSLLLWTKVKSVQLKRTAGITLLLLGLQLGLGISNVILGLPLSVALSHNAVAALLLLSIVTCLHYLWPPKESV